VIKARAAEPTGADEPQLGRARCRAVQDPLSVPTRAPIPGRRRGCRSPVASSCGETREQPRVHQALFRHRHSHPRHPGRLEIRYYAPSRKGLKNLSEESLEGIKFTPASSADVVRGMAKKARRPRRRTDNRQHRRPPRVPSLFPNRPSVTGPKRPHPRPKGAKTIALRRNGTASGCRPSRMPARRASRRRRPSSPALLANPGLCLFGITEQHAEAAAVVLARAARWGGTGPAGVKRALRSTNRGRWSCSTRCPGSTEWPLGRAGGRPTSSPGTWRSWQLRHD